MPKQSDYSHIAFSWFGDVTSISGNAQHARALLEPLIRGGASVHIIPWNTGRPIADLSQWWKDALDACTKTPPGPVLISHCPPNMAKLNATGGPTVVLTHWETKDLPVEWAKPLSNPQITEVWVPNGTTAGSPGLQSVGKPIRVLRMPVDTERVNKFGKLRSIVGADDNSFVFGVTGTWNNRKNMTDLIVAYLTEFHPVDNTTLVIKTNGQKPEDPNERARLLGLVKDVKKALNKPDMPRIVVLQDILGYDTMGALINRFDCFVSSSRGEGKNISGCYAMALGKPLVFVSNHANEDFVLSKASNVYPVQFNHEPVMQMGNFYSARDLWARPDTSELMAQMRRAYNDVFSMDNKAKAACARRQLQYLQKYHDPQTIVDDLAKWIDELSPVKAQALNLGLGSVGV